MVQKISHELRRHEIVAPYGVGAIVDVLGESLIAPDTSHWDRAKAPVLSCPRLVDSLGGGELREPPTHAGKAGSGTSSLLYWRFPTWRFCERCGSVTRLTYREKGKWANRCSACKAHLVPMRFVACCQRGSHLQDIPWFKWVHRGRNGGPGGRGVDCSAYDALHLRRQKNTGEGLRSLRVECSDCGSHRTLDELVQPSALARDGISCSGVQPWQDPAFGHGCDSPLVAVQRGSTSNYVAEVVSALDIPEAQTAGESLAQRIRDHMFYSSLGNDDQRETLAGFIADDLGSTTQTVLQVATKDSGESVKRGVLELKDGEWAAFLEKFRMPRDESQSDFVVDGWRVGDSWPLGLRSVISGVGQVRRVREVRALKGFRRLSPEAQFVPSSLDVDPRQKRIFPAVETFGEGIFIQFNEEALQQWERQPEVVQRARVLMKRREEQPWAARLDMPEPRFVAIHTLAHLLMLRLAFASGYSSASLRERIYASTERADSTAGLLITTSAGDAQGTMGGLVRLGSPDRLLRVILEAVSEAEVCTNDPVCIESDRQGASQLNLSACHGCALVSETSCETGNRLLDRQLLLGGTAAAGLFQGLLDEVRGARSAPYST